MEQDLVQPIFCQEVWSLAAKRKLPLLTVIMVIGSAVRSAYLITTALLGHIMIVTMALFRGQPMFSIIIPVYGKIFQKLHLPELLLMIILAIQSVLPMIMLLLDHLEIVTTEILQVLHIFRYTITKYYLTSKQST